MSLDRVLHRFSLRDVCERCGATRQAIEDGFVNVLCSGKPIADWRKTLALKMRKAHTAR